MYLGLDLGTSGLKGLIVSPQGHPVTEASSSYDVSQPHADWSEQDPQLWIDATENILIALRSSDPDNFKKIRGIAVSGQMHGAVVVDKTGTPLRPCILWNDMRSAAQANVLDTTPNVRELSGNIVFPGFTAPKLKWLADNEHDVFASIHKVLLPKDYLLYWLTGRFVTDMSDAAGTSWLDVGARVWSDELLAASGMRRDQMPDLIEGSEKVGSLLESIQIKFELPNNINVIAGGADNAVAACGVGAIQEGQGFVSLGTSGVLLAARDAYAPAPETAVHTFCHAVPNRWYQMGVILSATNSLNWLAQTLGTDPKSLSTLIQDIPTGPSNVLFLPYLSGERTPHNDAQIGGAFIGLKIDTSDADLTQAVMEGVCFALRDCLEALKKTGANLQQILAIGGGTNSPFWLETLATILDVDLALPEKGDFGGALGAARLAMIGDGAEINAVCTPPNITQIIHPIKSLTSQYDAAYARYKKLYPLLKELG